MIQWFNVYRDFCVCSKQTSCISTFYTFSSFLNSLYIIFKRLILKFPICLLLPICLLNPLETWLFNYIGASRIRCQPTSKLCGIGDYSQGLFVSFLSTLVWARVASSLNDLFVSPPTINLNLGYSGPLHSPARFKMVWRSLCIFGEMPVYKY